MKHVLFALCLLSMLLLSNNCTPKVTISEQVWMKKNLNVDKYRNGDPIRYCGTNEEWTDARSKKEGAWCNYDNDPSNGKKYGKLYNWYAVNDPRGLAPDGWRVPSDGDWATLINNIGGIDSAAGKLKEIGLFHWQSPNTGATNEKNFFAVPGGWRNDNGIFFDIGKYALWWSSTEYNASSAWFWGLDYERTNVDRIYYIKGNGVSVRCVKNK